jgi:hypothetical protein
VPRGVLFLPMLMAILFSISGLYLASMQRFFQYLNNRIH